MEIIVACEKEKKEGDRERKKEIHTRNIMKRKEKKRKLGKVQRVRIGCFFLYIYKRDYINIRYLYINIFKMIKRLI